jgi:PhnB protein
MVKAIPDEYHRVTPYLIADGAAGLIDFMKQAFGANERSRMPMPDGKIAHAELTIGDSVVMLSDGSEQFGPMPAMLHMYVEDVDGAYRQALEAGATRVREPENQFYGDRSATVRDRWGNLWSLATHVEDVSEEEMMRRMQQMGAPAGSG